MGITFNPDEILQMAEQIERNAGKFYRQAAGRAKDRSTRGLFEELAAMEDGHLQVFSAMRARLTERQKEPTVFDPDDQIGLYLQAMADAKGIEGKIGPDMELTGNETAEQVLNIALNAEHNSVVFYVGLKALVKADEDRHQVEQVIQEEMGHIATLHRRLMALR